MLKNPKGRRVELKAALEPADGIPGQPAIHETGRAFAESFLFDGFRLDRRGLFRVDQAGRTEPAALGSRALDLLFLLLERQGELVPKDLIMEVVWPRIVVEENNLTVQISALRRILDRDRERGSCVQTVSGRGYCFTAAVTRVAAETRSGARRLKGNRRSQGVPSFNSPTEGSGEAGADIASWFSRLGLEQYEQVFRENDVDSKLLRRLTGEDLLELGVATVGHRRRLLDAIAVLGAPAADASRIIAETTATPAPTGDAQRRQLTVMFCDLVGSTALFAPLDPEDLREIIATCHRAVAKIVAGLDGFVAKYMGDGVLV